MRPAIVVDGANVVGSVPDGWWRDRAGAAGRLRDRLAAAGRRRGWMPGRWASPATRWYPEWTLVVEGQARARAGRRLGGLAVVRADGEGDDTIAAEAARLVAPGARSRSSRATAGWRARATDAGATVRGAGWLLDLLP